MEQSIFKLLLQEELRRYNWSETDIRRAVNRLDTFTGDPIQVATELHFNKELSFSKEAMALWPNQKHENYATSLSAKEKTIPL